MKTYVFTRRSDPGVNALIRKLGATKLTRFDGMRFWQRRSPVVFPPGSVLIYWGYPGPPIPGVVTLNSISELSVGNFRAPGYKLPANTQVRWASANRHGLFAVPEGLSPHVRKNGRYEPSFLFSPDYHEWVYRIKHISEELKLHVFDKRIFLTGIKKPTLPIAASEETWQRGRQAHPWYRSHLTGWETRYGVARSTRTHRNVALRAVESMGLLFGAANIIRVGNEFDFFWQVRNVDTAPVLSPKYALMYARRIEQYLEKNYEALQEAA